MSSAAAAKYTTPPETAARTASAKTGYWPLDESSGQTTADVSGNGNGGVLGSTSAV